MIFVLSDTHVPERMTKLPQKFLDQIKSDDIIFHAGDFVRWEVFQKLKSLATLHAVFGNMDDAQIGRLLPQKKSGASTRQENRIVSWIWFSLQIGGEGLSRVRGEVRCVNLRAFACSL